MSCCFGCYKTTDPRYPFYDPRNHTPDCPAGQPKDVKNKLGTGPRWIPRYDSYFDEEY